MLWVLNLPVMNFSPYYLDVKVHMGITDTVYYNNSGILFRYKMYNVMYMYYNTIPGGLHVYAK